MIYLFHTGLNIVFVVSVLNQYMHYSKKVHLESIYKIFMYLKRSPHGALFFKRSETNNIEVFSNADRTSSVKDRRSTIKYYTFVFENIVT